jgi:hypothetical protein
MANPATALDPDTLKAALLAKGMLADRGRYSPFAGDAGVSTGLSTGDAGTLQSAVAGNAASDGSVVRSSGAAPNNTALPIPDDALNSKSEGDATGILAALGLGAAAIAAYLMRRRKTLNTPTTEVGAVDDSVPLVEGEDIGVAPKAKATGDHIVDGEVVEQGTPITHTKRIGQGVSTPDNEGMKALGAPKEVDVPKVGQTRVLTQDANTKPVPKQTLAQAMAARSTQVEKSDLPAIPLTDSYSDLTPEQLNQAETLTEQLRRNRMTGNAAGVRRVIGTRTTRSTAPTGTVSRESLFNTIIELMRRGHINPRSVARVVP